MLPGCHGTKIHLVCIQPCDLQGDPSLVILFFQLKSLMLMHTNVQESMLGVEPAKSCVISSDLSDS